VTAADARRRGYRTAWSDAEHVRLAMERSWWDETRGPVERAFGPLPADRDPWLTEPPKAEQHREAA
jgi:hypothetical protein